MSEDHKRVFVSYDWGNSQHENWVFDLVRDLRRDGVNAMIDKLITQTRTVQLERMMINEMKNSDHVVIVLTQNYARKSESMQGGVGFETLLTLPDLLTNPDKYIYILRHDGNFQNAVPHHLRGFHFINFSNDKEFDSKYNELLYRIEGVPYYELPPLGKKKELKSQTSVENTRFSETDLFDEIILPKSKKHNDLEKNQFVSKTYNEIIELFNKLLKKLKQENSNFEFTNETITHQKNIFTIYIDGNIKTAFKVWRGHGIFKGINFQFGHMIDIHSDNSMNENLTFNYKEDGTVTMQLAMNFLVQTEFKDTASVVKQIWSSHIEQYLKR